MNSETKGMFLTMGDRTASLWAGVRGMPIAIHVLALPAFEMPCTESSTRHKLMQLFHWVIALPSWKGGCQKLKCWDNIYKETCQLNC